MAATLEDTFNICSNGSYFVLKWSITGPVVLLGNLLDLCTLGVSKKLINVSPIMTNIPFFREITREKEKSYENIAFVNKGFAGLFRMVATLAITLPLEIVAPVIGIFLTAMYLFAAHVLGDPLTQLAACVAANMCT